MKHNLWKVRVSMTNGKTFYHVLHANKWHYIFKMLRLIPVPISEWLLGFDWVWGRRGLRKWLLISRCRKPSREAMEWAVSEANRLNLLADDGKNGKPFSELREEVERQNHDR